MVLDFGITWNFNSKNVFCDGTISCILALLNSPAVASVHVRCSFGVPPASPLILPDRPWSGQAGGHLQSRAPKSGHDVLLVPHSLATLPRHTYSTVLGGAVWMAAGPGEGLPVPVKGRGRHMERGMENGCGLERWRSSWRNVPPWAPGANLG